MVNYNISDEAMDEMKRSIIEEVEFTRNGPMMIPGVVRFNGYEKDVVLNEWAARNNRYFIPHPPKENLDMMGFWDNKHIKRILAKCEIDKAFEELLEDL